MKNLLGAVLLILLSSATIVFAEDHIQIDYPVKHTTYQRHSDFFGEIIISGTYVGTPTSIEASFNGAPFEEIASLPSDGKYYGKLNASVGQGNLTVRFSDNPFISAGVEYVAIGDIFVIAGQSNAAGFGEYYSNLNESNIYLASAFKLDGNWYNANDPVNAAGSPWPGLADKIIQNQNIPVAFIATAEGGTPIFLWQKGFWCYDQMIDTVKKATNGTMKVKAMLFFQGERDAIGDMPESEYNAYKSNLTKMALDFISETKVAEKVLVGQINMPQDGMNRNALDIIRKAQRDAWYETNYVFSGPLTYDINTTTGVHFSKQDEIKVLANRWYYSVQKEIYGIGDGLGPEIIDARMKYGDNQTILLSFYDESLPLTASDWKVNPEEKIGGFRIEDSGKIYTDENITSTKIYNSQIEITLNTNISSSAKISYGSLLDGFGKNVVIDSANGIPAEPFSNLCIDVVPVNEYSLIPAMKRTRSFNICTAYIPYSPRNTKHNISEHYEEIPLYSAADAVSMSGSSASIVVAEIKKENEQKNSNKNPAKKTSKNKAVLAEKENKEIEKNKDEKIVVNLASETAVFQNGLRIVSIKRSFLDSIIEFLFGKMLLY